MAIEQWDRLGADLEAAYTRLLVPKLAVTAHAELTIAGVLRPPS